MTTSNSANTKQSNNASQKRKPIHNGYFNHPTSSSSNIPMSILIREQGLEIYGLYWVMLEEAHAQLKCCVNIQTMGIIANIFHAQPEHLELLSPCPLNASAKMIQPCDCEKIPAFSFVPAL